MPLASSPGALFLNFQAEPQFGALKRAVYLSKRLLFIEN